MKLKEVIKQLKAFVKQNPEASELDVLYSIEPDEHYYDEFKLDLEIGIYDGIDFGTLDEYDENNIPNSIRIN